MLINYKSTAQKGISLIELVIFIVILSIALTSITLIYINTTRYSADPMVRIRSVELAQATLEEILLKAYDENTPVGGGCVSYVANTKCTDASQPSPFDETALQAEEALPGIPNPGNPTIRAIFNDVDDYNNLAYCGTGAVAHSDCTNPCIPMVDESGNDISNEYSGFSVCIKVSFAAGVGAEINGFENGVGSPVLANDAKRIDIIVIDPLKSQVGLSAYRLNF